jgi:hypothetical protein
MNRKPVPGIIPLLITLCSVACCSAQTAKFAKIYPADSNSSGFLYIEYCGNRYNKYCHRQEFVISVVKLPVGLLKKMPRLKDNRAYSSRNIRTLGKQQEFLRQHGREKIILRANKKILHETYPQGLRRGMIIESAEYNNWNFLEMPLSPVPPEKKDWGTDPDIYEFYLDPLNLLEDIITTG